MKKNLIYFISLFFIFSMHSQNIEDAIRYSDGETQGTARFKAMAGAFGALGADISGISINPAGAAIFNTSHGVLSASTKNNTKVAKPRNPISITRRPTPSANRLSANGRLNNDSSMSRTPKGPTWVVTW